jgi:hypothetical protein
MMNRDEVRRLDGGAHFDERPAGTLVRVALRCDGNAQEVLERCKEVLRSILLTETLPWPGVDKWRTTLPQWFVTGCYPEITRDEAERRRALPLAAREKFAQQWSLGAFIHWFKPSERTWQWWDARAIDENSAEIRLVAESLPFAVGALKWLCEVAGAKTVSEPMG